MRLDLCRHLGWRGDHQRLRGVDVVDVGGDGDVLAPIGREAANMEVLRRYRRARSGEHTCPRMSFGQKLAHLLGDSGRVVEPGHVAGAFDKAQLSARQYHRRHHHGQRQESVLSKAVLPFPAFFRDRQSHGPVARTRSMSPSGTWTPQGLYKS